MKLLVLSAADVHELLGFGECVAAMRGALTGLASGRAFQPLRTIVATDRAPGLMGLMPAYLPAGPGPAGRAAYGLKAICITPGNPAAGLDAHQGLVLVSDGQTGEPLAVLNASAVTEIRTAAMSVLAADVLARPGAADLAVIGTGRQARAHVLAFSQTRDLRRVRIAGRTPERAAAFAAALQPEVTVEVTACGTAAAAVEGAGIIVTATSSATPVLHRAWICAGAHVSAVGACLPTARELDTATVAGGVLFADRRESLLQESGDYRLAVADGRAGPGHIRAELGEVLLGTAPGRASATEITIFESLGLAVEDLAAAQAAYQKAAAAGAGQWADF